MGEPESENLLRPIKVVKENVISPNDGEQYMKYLRERHTRRLQWWFLGTATVILLGLVVAPLSALLIRLALGG